MSICLSGGGSSWDKVRDLAAKNGVRLEQAKGKGSKKSFHRESQAFAMVKDKKPADLNEAFFSKPERQYGLWLALDQIQDPQNLGALFRSAAFFGVCGIVLTKERSAGLSETVYDIASGGVEEVPFTFVPNLRNAIEAAKKGGLWTMGTSEHAEKKVEDLGFDRSWMVVLGNEEKGLRKLTESLCDEMCHIPSSADYVRTLNVATAGAIILTKLQPP
jgi:23S rRNA (guanosine2251-2'-O)-methyltransferase